MMQAASGAVPAAIAVMTLVSIGHSWGCTESLAPVCFSNISARRLYVSTCGSYCRPHSTPCLPASPAAATAAVGAGGASAAAVGAATAAAAVGAGAAAPLAVGSLLAG